ncbi:OmpP1/FadL family transporter [Thalassococcus sp. S3]|uniref:OmpP1/FadL family transporter n=1 Tax=Thalassococcus sp. S3 TaxID=2017482 RepID=UPI0010248CB0|nr:outer membrane protein transport protein [Thalassococcus sp. S3]QBF31721.1 hypothetical protein CFI11_10885 [Thalassococcus sp. S3]
MKTQFLAAIPLCLSVTLAQAGGLDRNGQPIGILFEEGNYAEFSFGRTSPSLTGTDLATAGPTGDVALSFNNVALGLKMDITDQLSFALIADEPFGSDIQYPVSATSPLLGGTSAFSSSTALTGLLRYEFDDRISVHGGLRVLRTDGNITLSGQAYGPPPPVGLSGYNVALDADTALGYVVGAAYEIPDIALRVALTYNSEIEHEFDTRENVAPGVVSTTNTTVPQSINLDFQTGIAPRTLLFGSIRWAEWSATKVRPQGSGVDLIDLNDTTTFTLGLGRQFTDRLSGSIAFGYEAEDDDTLVSPLAPTNGFRSISVGLSYDVDDNITVAGGIRYTDLGDAFAETGTPDTARASFSGNDAVSLGLRVGFRF